MLHSIITVLTTAAVALHALLGCCAHHAHSGDSDQSGLKIVHSVEGDGRCSHGHHHDEAVASPSEDVANSCNHEHDDGGQHGCDEGDCSFTPAQRISDAQWMFASSKWCQACGDVAHADALVVGSRCTPLPQHRPVPLYSSGSARALTQVWRL